MSARQARRSHGVGVRSARASRPTTCSSPRPAAARTTVPTWRGSASWKPTRGCCSIDVGGRSVVARWRSWTARSSAAAARLSAACRRDLPPRSPQHFAVRTSRTGRTMQVRTTPERRARPGQAITIMCGIAGFVESPRSDAVQPRREPRPRPPHVRGHPPSRPGRRGRVGGRRRGARHAAAEHHRPVHRPPADSQRGPHGLDRLQRRDLQLPASCGASSKRPATASTRPPTPR